MVWSFVLALQLLFTPVKAKQVKTIYESLPNGTQIIAFIRPDTLYFVASLWVRQGSAADLANREGTAHLLEHLLPLKPLVGTTIQIAMEQQGALLIPETARDFMAFHLQAHRVETLTQVFPLLVEAVRDLAVDPKVLEREKRLIELEIMALYEDPLWLTKTWLEAELFKGTPYAHPPAGWLETISQLSLSDVKQFHRSNFIAPNFALIAVVPNEEALVALKDAVLHLPSELTTPSLPVHNEPRFLPSIESLLRKFLTRSKEAFWGIGWRIPVMAEEKVAVEALVMHLRQILVPIAFGQVGVVQEWNMVANSVKGEVALTISARLRPYTELVEKRLLQALTELAQNGLTKSDLNRLKERLAWEHYKVASAPIRFVRKVGWAWALHGDPRVAERYPELVANLSSEQVRRVAAKLASLQPFTLLVRK